MSLIHAGLQTFTCRYANLYIPMLFYVCSVLRIELRHLRSTAERFGRDVSTAATAVPPSLYIWFPLYPKPVMQHINSYPKNCRLKCSLYICKHNAKTIKHISHYSHCFPQHQPICFHATISLFMKSSPSSIIYCFSKSVAYSL